MLVLLLGILVLLWLLGYITLPFVIIPTVALFTINGQVITLLDLLITLILAWIVGLLPSPFREIAGALLILWILSKLGILLVVGLSNILIIAIIVGLAIYLISGV